jgi:hypothetical protein
MHKQSPKKIQRLLPQMGGARVLSLSYNPRENSATGKNRDVATHSSSRIQEEMMEIEQVLNEYRNGDEDTRLCLFLTYRELRDELSGIDQDGAVDQSPILWSSTFIHRGIMETILTFFSNGFRHPKSCCFFSAGAGRTR